MVKRSLRKLASFYRPWINSASRQDFLQGISHETFQMSDFESSKYEGYFDMRKEETKSILLRQKKLSESKENVAQINWPYDDTCVLRQMDAPNHILYYATLQNQLYKQPKLQPEETISATRLNLQWSNSDDYINRPR